MALLLALGLFIVSSLTSIVSATPVAKWGSLSIPGNQASRLMLGVGVFDFNHRGPARHNHRAPDFEGQFQLGKKWYGIGPLMGLMVNTEGGYMGYLGLYTRFRYHHLVVTPEFAVGGYQLGSGKYLGGTLEFRPGISVAWRFSNDQRLGVRFAHISNGGLHHRNPSEQELMLTYSLPMP